MGIFNSVAQRIAEEIRPTTALDAGCAIGLLVESLRQHKIEAWGVDVSEYAIQNVHPSVRPYCWLGNVIDPFPRNYDLIICIEVLEHLAPQQAELAVRNMCLHSDDILFSSTPFDYKEATHINVQPPEYWAGLFAKFDFYHDLDFDAAFITPWAMRFRKLRNPIHRVISAYEHRLSRLAQENKARREFNLEQRNELVTKEGEIQDLLSQKEALLSQQEALVEGFAREKEQLSEKIAALERTVESLNRLVFEKDTIIQDILNSRSWRVIKRFQKLRLRLIPLESRRESAFLAILHGLSVLRRYGLKTFSQRVIASTSHQFRMLILKRKLRKKSGKSNLLADLYIKMIAPSAEVMPHQASVDTIICVHNALEDVQRCLESVVRYSTPPYNIILVDDGSNEPTREYLNDFARSQGATLLRNDQPLGYTRSANLGLKQSSANYAVLLNSDTIVTPKWLDRMIACGESDEEIGLIGPLSNTASWQSIPEIFASSGDWAENTLPRGMSIAEMGEQVAKASARLYPRIPILNGFCLMIKRAVLDQIGYLDEETFGEGYGEENDYCLRARTAGWQSAVADDTYIYHAQSRSYSHTRRLKLVERADRALVSRYGQQLMSESALRCRNDRVLQGIRARSRVAPLRAALLDEGLRHWEGKRMLFIMPLAEPGGGGHVIIQEAEAMVRMGVEVNFVNLQRYRASFEQSHPELEITTHYVESPRHIIARLPKYDALVATVFHSVEWMDIDAQMLKHIVRGYYIQDFEPDFFPSGTAYHNSAWHSYTRFPDLVRMTKTEWNRNIIQANIGVECQIVGPSLDIDLFRPRRRTGQEWPHRPLRIAAMIRPSTPRRQPEMTMRVLKQLAQKHQGKIDIILFGCQTEDPDFQKLDLNFNWRNAGILTRPQLASLLNEMDVFIDLSTFQAMGLTALEAMACGVGVIVPQRGGADSFARHEQNALLVETDSEEASLAAVERLISEEKLRSYIQESAIIDACQFFPEKAARNILEALFPRNPQIQH